MHGGQRGAGSGSGRGRRAAAWVAGSALAVLHLLPSAAPSLAPRGRLVLGVPEELAWRLGWMALAFLYLLWFCAAVWRDEEPAP